MMKYCKLIFITFFMAYTNYFAQNEIDVLRLSEPGIGYSGKALGMGNSFIAIANDYSATYFNPAGLGQLKNSFLSGGLSFDNTSNETNLFNSKTEYSHKNTTLNQFGFVYSYPTRRGSFVIALGYSQNKDFNGGFEFNGYNTANSSMIQELTDGKDDLAYELRTSYGVFDEDDNYLYDETSVKGRLNQSGSIREEGEISAYTASAAIEIAPRLFVGGTLNLYGGTYKRDKEYYEDDSKNVYRDLLIDGNESTRDFETFNLNDIVEWNLSGYDFKFGIHYTFNRFLSFGATIKTPSEYTIEETYSREGYSQFASKRYDYKDKESEIEYDIQTPYEIAMGLAYSYKGAKLSGQITMIDYTQMEFTEGLGNNYRSDINKNIDDIFTTVFNYNFGAEFKLPRIPMKLRAGFMYYSSPYDGDPSAFDKKYITFGGGVLLGKVLIIDAAYSYGWWDTFGDNYGTNLSRTYQDVTRDKFILSFTYRM